MADHTRARPDPPQPPQQARTIAGAARGKDRAAAPPPFECLPGPGSAALTARRARSAGLHCPHTMRGEEEEPAPDAAATATSATTAGAASSAAAEAAEATEAAEAADPEAAMEVEAGGKEEDEEGEEDEGEEDESVGGGLGIGRPESRGGGGTRRTCTACRSAKAGVGWLDGWIGWGGVGWGGGGGGRLELRGALIFPLCIIHKS